ncbi:hypothetical protein D3H65_30590 [Paraflavitalea soli]|uniref:DUF3592 domain-containing protein n=1 Tax=Paraflavitalea soli TaxID=2315862 RepID=A0A3B7MYD1_9BACT|nr:hypothetical protein D3H65_30590 [Paraflavitalea soli]
MAVAYIFLAVLFIYTAVHSIRFLKTYYTLQKKGERAIGTITNNTLSGKFFIRNALVPTIIFYTGGNRKIVGRPRHSLQIELSFYRHGSEHLIYYKPDDPALFVVSNSGEVLATIAMLCVAIGYLGWFGITQLVPML